MLLIPLLMNRTVNSYNPASWDTTNLVNNCLCSFQYILAPGMWQSLWLSQCLCCCSSHFLSTDLSTWSPLVMTHLASMVNEGEERSRLLAWESANEDWYLFEDQHCHDTSYWFAVVSLEFSIQVAHVACPVDSAMGGGLLCGVIRAIRQLHTQHMSQLPLCYTSKWRIIGFHCHLNDTSTRQSKWCCITQKGL